jgi:hypothetical protein
MPIYPYRCSNKHYTEKFFPMGTQAKELDCPCGETAKRVYTVPQISVDNMDKVDMTITTGRNFSNKREFESWLKAKGAHVMEDSEWADDRQWLEEQTEIRHEFEAKGIDFNEYEKDRKQREARYQDEKLKELGVKLESASKEDFLNANESTGWVDTVEDKYAGSDGRMVRQTERVECPYSDLTNGAVSNV